jgi:hypothetical protein
MLLCLMTFSVIAQKRVLAGTKQEAVRKCSTTKGLVDSTKPAVFITFLRRERIEPVDKNDDHENLFFKLINNSCWPIWLRMSGVSNKRYGDASLYYAIEDRNSGELLSGSLGCHVCSVNPINSGKHIVFSIPLREASRDTIMRLSYEFDWERNVFGDYENSNTLHTVSFYFNGLSESVLPKSLIQP